MARSTFEKYGGFAKISRIVAAFYDKVLDSPRLSPFFEGTSMKRQIDHQTKFIASLMGGPVTWFSSAPPVAMLTCLVIGLRYLSPARPSQNNSLAHCVPMNACELRRVT